MSDQMSLIDPADVERLPGPATTGREEFLQKQMQENVRRMHASVADWQLPELPDLSQFDEVILDLESDGLRWWDGNRMVGCGLWTPDGKTRYLPIRHKVGPNIPEEQFFRWARTELRGKKITNIRLKFDCHLFRADGINLETQGNTFADVAHYAALLDDHRRLFNQEDLAEAYLRQSMPDFIGKVKSVHGYELDPTKYAEYPAGMVAPRAEGDVMTVFHLRRVMWPLMTEQDLHRVREIEEKIIPVVVEMEHNGAPLDLEKLRRWLAETEKIVEECMWDIKRQTGVSMTSPTKRAELFRVFSVLNIAPPEGIDFKTGEPTGKASFADDLLKPIQNVTVQTIRKATQFKSLHTKLKNYDRGSTSKDGILRYELHQLPYQKEKEYGGDEGHGGAVSGRFSSARPSADEGANIQQVFGVGTQEESTLITPADLHLNGVTAADIGTKVKVGFTKDYLVKDLFVPDRRVHKNAQWFKADASQFQFRLFAHYGNEPKLIEAYADDLRRALMGEELADFHKEVGRLIKEYAKKDLSRTHIKNVNFAQVFAAGIRKMSLQLGVPKDQIPGRREPLDSGGPLFQEVVNLSTTYHTMFPGVKPLLALTSHLAMPDHKTGEYGCGKKCRELYAQGYYHRGYVKTYLGRRARFGLGDRDYSALNRIIQGTEGDVAKRIMIEIHNMRDELGLTERFVVHDELDADLHDPGDRDKVVKVLNTQYYDFRVPILWETKMGPTWARAK
jgi:DNA polymerase I-like protein with 3'-5' exonuclease and polymerase domains